MRHVITTRDCTRCCVHYCIAVVEAQGDPQEAGAGGAASSAARDERLLNLVIALLNTRRPMRREQIRSQVRGYGGTSDQAFHRMLERDKATLRALGIPVQAIDQGSHASEVGYRIDPGQYALPPISLSAAQFGVLSLASRLWSDAVTRTASLRAVTKLRGASPTKTHTLVGYEGEGLLEAYSPHIPEAGDALETLLTAIDERRTVTFSYPTAAGLGSGQADGGGGEAAVGGGGEDVDGGDGEAAVGGCGKAADSSGGGLALAQTSQLVPNHAVTSRTVEPWRLVVQAAGWYLLGWDRSRSQQRTFRLSRIAGSVTLGQQAQAFEPPDQVDSDAIFARHAQVPLAAAARRSTAQVSTAQVATAQSTTAQASDSYPVTPAPDEAICAVLAVTPGKAVAVRARPGAQLLAEGHSQPGGRDLLRVPGLTLARWAEECAAQGDAVAVLDPPALRDLVVEHLRCAALLSPEAGGTAGGTVRATGSGSDGDADVADAHGDAVFARVDVDASGISSSRLLRMLSLVAHLDAVGQASIRSLAMRFEVPVGKIIDDLNLLYVSGLPGYMPDDLIDFRGDITTEGVVGLVQGQGIENPLRLSSREAIAVVTALQALADSPAVRARQDVAATVESTLRQLRHVAGIRADALEVKLPAQGDPQVEKAIVDALDQGACLHIRYVSKTDQLTSRSVIPQRYITRYGHAYLLAWCTTARSERMFRMDRIVAAQLAGEHQQTETANVDSALPWSRVQLTVDARGQWLAEELVCESVTAGFFTSHRQAPGSSDSPALPDAQAEQVDIPCLHLTLLVQGHQWLTSLVLRYAPLVLEVKPPALAAHIGQAAARALDAYGRLGLSM